MKLLVALLVLMSLSIPAHASGTDEDLAEIKAHEKAVKESDAKYKTQKEKNMREAAALSRQSKTRRLPTQYARS